MRIALALLMLVSAKCFAGGAVEISGQANKAAFLNAVNTHINAIKARDLDTLLSTVTTSEKLTLVFPGGATLLTRQEYVDFHREWFADEEWVMDIEMVSHDLRNGHGTALVRTTYTDQAGPRQALLALHFTLEDNHWRLFFDQNTRIVEDTRPAGD